MYSYDDLRLVDIKIYSQSQYKKKKKKKKKERKKESLKTIIVIQKGEKIRGSDF